MPIGDLMPWSRKSGEPGRGTSGDDLVLDLQRNMNSVFDRFWQKFEGGFGGAGRGSGVDMPRTDIVETDGAIEVAVELPGMDEKDIDVSLTDDVLTIKGEKKTEHEKTEKGYVLSERAFGSFYRSIPLPAGVARDEVEAVFKKGVLTLTLPKSPASESKVKKIDVKAA